MKLVNISESDSLKLRSIKTRALAGEPVSADEKQWVLDLARKMNKRLPNIVVQNAAKQGFNTLGLMVKG